MSDTVLLILLGAGAGFAAGLVGGGISAGSPERAAVPIASPESSYVQELLAKQVELLERMDRTLEVLQSAPRSSAAQPAARSGAGEAAAPDPARLADSIAELAAAIRHMQARGVSGGSSTAAPLRNDVGVADPKLAFGFVHDLRSRVGGERATEEALRADHLLWSQRDILRTYGKPSEIWVASGGSGSVSWHYELYEEGEDVTFVFFDGLVVNVDYDCRE